MPYDLHMAIGITILALSIPAALNAWIDRRLPIVSGVLIVMGGGLMAYAWREKPGGYQWQDLPTSFITVIGHYL
ncbi:hypothetical protein [uncultured Maritimibacter sp.]|jgi:hypothetical protein|uniref:hypothetical protein n=1 Tax=uncultured Maritimibacter sp. TaxID=991866 RepID=UPI002604558D|nr:hypothetical protein [uncultured Maritimibacter sp.]